MKKFLLSVLSLVCGLSVSATSFILVESTSQLEVGKKYMELNPVIQDENMKEVMEAVYGLEDQLNELKKQLQEMKGTVKCDVCGTQCDAEAAFCSKCGAELKKEDIIVDAEEVVIEPADIEDSVE